MLYMHILAQLKKMFRGKIKSHCPHALVHTEDCPGSDSVDAQTEPNTSSSELTRYLLLSLWAFAHTVPSTWKGLSLLSLWKLVSSLEFASQLSLLSLASLTPLPSPSRKSWLLFLGATHPIVIYFLLKNMVKIHTVEFTLLSAHFCLF